MSKDTPQARTLYRAVSVCGGIKALASALGVSVGELSYWLDGHVAPPTEVYIRALDMVAGGRDTGR
jgi:hypothetical protein